LKFDSSVGAIWNAPDNNSLSGYTASGQVSARVLPAGAVSLGASQGANPAPGYKAPPTTLSAGVSAQGKMLPVYGQAGLTYSVEVWNSKKGFFPSGVPNIKRDSIQAFNTYIGPWCSSCRVPE
jgi:hypothetical protein